MIGKYGYWPAGMTAHWWMCFTVCGWPHVKFFRLSLDRVSGTLCLSHYVTEILYSLRDFWRHFGWCRAAAHSDCCFFAPCTNILTYLLTYLSDDAVQHPCTLAAHWPCPVQNQFSMSHNWQGRWSDSDSAWYWDCQFMIPGHKYYASTIQPRHNYQCPNVSLQLTTICMSTPCRGL